MSETLTPDAYSVDDRDTYSRISIPEKITPSYLNEANWGCLSEALASDYFYEHDGWESRWPVTLYVWCGEKIAASFSVDMEASPHFNSYGRVDEVSS